MVLRRPILIHIELVHLQKIVKNRSPPIVSQLQCQGAPLLHGGIVGDQAIVGRNGAASQEKFRREFAEEFLRRDFGRRQ
jgi:hypothetical protein